MSFFCDECGAVLFRGRCININCSQSQRPPEQDIVIVEDSTEIIDQITTDNHINDSVTDIPLNKNAIRFVCFSDWRSQSVSSILNFVKSLNPGPDLILYAGDDVRRFVEMTDESIFHLIERGMRILIPYSRTKTLPTLRTISKFLIDEMTHLHDIKTEFEDVNPPSDEQVQIFFQQCSNEGFRAFNYKLKRNKGTNSSPTAYYYRGDDIEGEKEILKTFLHRYNFIQKFIDQFQSLPAFNKLLVRIHESFLSIKFEFTHFSYVFRWKIQETELSLTTSISETRVGDLLYFLKWLEVNVKQPTTKVFQKYLQEMFDLQVFAEREKYESTRSILGKMWSIVPAGCWMVILSLKPSYLLSYVARNYFNELAMYTTKGLLAIIGNDCYPSHKLLIQGDKVTDLGESPICIDNYVLLGLEGAESIKSTLSERSIEEDYQHGDIGITIYSKEEYQSRLQRLSSDEYRKKIKVILSHPPPFQCLDLARRFGQAFIGSMALREAIIADPMIKLVVCGHVHQHGGKHEYLNKAVVVNCASHDLLGSPGNVAIVDLDKRSGKLVNIVWKEIGSTLQLKIWGIGPKYASILEKAGYNSPEDLLEDSVEVINQRSKRQIGKKRLAKFSLRADAVVNNKIVHMKNVTVPSFEEL